MASSDTENSASLGGVNLLHSMLFGLTNSIYGVGLLMNVIRSFKGLSLKFNPASVIEDAEDPTIEALRFTPCLFGLLLIMSSSGSG